MTKKLTVEEKKVKAEAHDALIKHVFDNIRNLLISVTVAAAGGAILRYRADLPFGSAFNLIVGILVIFASVGLFFWNMFHGVEKLVRPVKGTRKAWLLVPFAVMYMLVVIAMFQAWVRTQAEQQLRAASTKLATNMSIEEELRCKVARVPRVNLSATPRRLPCRFPRPASSVGRTTSA